MNKIIMFFAGIILVLMMAIALYLSGALFDAGNARDIEAFVFQWNDFSEERIGTPVPIERLSEKFIRERLVKKFITEYFYVTPDPENIATRTKNDSIMAALSAPSVFTEWKHNQVPEIEKMSGKKMLRIVSVMDEIVKLPNSDYWEVHYILKTWEKPNDMNQTPTIDHGVMNIKFELWKPYETRIREQRQGKRFDVQKYLNDGGDPAAIFKFRIDEVWK